MKRWNRKHENYWEVMRKRNDHLSVHYLLLSLSFSSWFPVAKRWNAYHSYYCEAHYQVFLFCTAFYWPDIWDLVFGRLVIQTFKKNSWQRPWSPGLETETKTSSLQVSRSQVWFFIYYYLALFAVVSDQNLHIQLVLSFINVTAPTSVIKLVSNRCILSLCSPGFFR